MDDDETDFYPFDRPHWTVSVSFPLDLIQEKEALFARVTEMAARRGGRPGQSCQPTEEMWGKTGYDTFSICIAFEAGDANTDGFIIWAREDLRSKNVRVAFDEADVTYPSEEECIGARRR